MTQDQLGRQIQALCNASGLSVLVAVAFVGGDKPNVIHMATANGVDVRRIGFGYGTMARGITGNVQRLADQLDGDAAEQLIVSFEQGTHTVSKATIVDDAKVNVVQRPPEAQRREPL